MREQLNKKNVLIEITEPESLVITIVRKKFVHAKILQVGSEVERMKAGDNVMCYNEGRELIKGNQKIRLVEHQSIVLKFNYGI